MDEGRDGDAVRRSFRAVKNPLYDTTVIETYHHMPVPTHRIRNAKSGTIGFNKNLLLVFFFFDIRKYTMLMWMFG